MIPFSRTDSPRRILVVDNNGDMRRLKMEMLSQYGYEVDAAEDGIVAWDALHAKNYDLVVTDHQMPNLSGLGLLKKLRAAHMALPVIMATETLPHEEFTRYPWLQTTAALLHPFTTSEFLGTVRQILRANETDRERRASQPEPNVQPGNT
jgi:DNA-binding response OmpR family regulator